MASDNRKKLKVWFNHWFSTVYYIIEMMKKNEHFDVCVTGSHDSGLAVYRNACDEWYAEPCSLSDEQYVDFCLDFCKQHNVQVFVPKKGMNAIVKRRAEFEEAGVKLFAESDFSLVELLDNKCLTYEKVRSFLPEIIPEYRRAKSYEQFVSGCKELAAKGYRVSYKLECDEGAASFRVIDDGIEGARGIREKPGCKITFQAACKVMSNHSFDNAVLIMPYLGGTECSADCCVLGGKTVCIPRFKTNKRYSEIIRDEGVIDACNRIVDKLGLEMPCNIQFKHDGQRFRLLEINTRMSGGLPLSCAAAGINMPSLALDKLMGVPQSVGDIQFGRKVVHIETPVCYL